MSRSYDIAVVGAGLVGLATARAILLRRPDARVLVIEKEQAVAQHQSGHNSGVIHAGVYYPAGSMKARLCRAGREALLRYAAERGLSYRLVGKLVVAADASELRRLSDLHERAVANGLKGVRELRPEEIREFEPHVRGVRALHVPETGVIDFAAVAVAYQRDVEMLGGELLLGTEVVGLTRTGREKLLITRSDPVAAKQVVVCAGLQSDRVARFATGRTPEYRIVPFRGDYFELRPMAAELVRGLIYPVPDPAFPFLGVHFTRRIDGRVWAGPNAVPALAREHYGRFGVDVRDALDVLSFPGTWRLARRYARTGIAEILRDYIKRAAHRQMCRYLPDLTLDDIDFGPSGIRAQILQRDGTLVDDFLLEQADGTLCVVNAPSPAATASLAIGEELATTAMVQPAGRT